MEDSGFIIVDSRFRPLYANGESIRILAYPNWFLEQEALDSVLAQKIHSFLPGGFGVCKAMCSMQFQSGRRLYYCRAFVVDDAYGHEMPEMKIALLMERGMPGYSRGTSQKRMPVGMKEDPFSFTPDPRYYHFSRGHHEVFDTLSSVVRERKGIGVVLAQAGMGKTALLGYLKESLTDEISVASFPGSFENRAELVRSVMAIIGMQGIGRDLSENLRHLEHWLRGRNESGRKVVLICDDAHELDFETIRNLSAFSDFEDGGQKLLQIIMAGRQELFGKLSDSRSESAGESVNVYCRLAPLDQAEVHSYVLHRLRIAGYSRQLFSPAALDAIALYSRGVPLNVHMICRHCLSLAAGISLPIVDEKIVANAAYDLVLRSQPVNQWDDADDLPGGHARKAKKYPRDRRGLRLV